MKKISYLFALVAISLFFVQCETEKIGQNGTHEGHEYVDLGLSVKWATCNVGAIAPEGFGDYFAWGEVETKEVYNLKTYKHCEDTIDAITKYCHNKEFGLNGFVDNKLELDPEDDAAHVNWGGKWRMPTIDELDDLRYSCTWEWATQNGVIGLLGTSRVEGYTDRTIFFPAAGHMVEDTLLYGEDYIFGLYWSKSVHDHLDPMHSSSVLLFFKNYNRIDFNYFYPRFTGATVRAVCP